jgi:2-keto-3-deoxy-L-rhamnonate aldolase RhmA
VRLEGVDMALIGPRDLSASLGKLNRFDDPRAASPGRSRRRAYRRLG